MSADQNSAARITSILLFFSVPPFLFQYGKKPQKTKIRKKSWTGKYAGIADEYIYYLSSINVINDIKGFSMVTIYRDVFVALFQMHDKVYWNQQYNLVFKLNECQVFYGEVR